MHYANNLFILGIVCTLCALLKNKLNLIDLFESKTSFEQLHGLKKENETVRQEELQQILFKTIKTLNLNQISLMFSPDANVAQTLYTGKKQGIIFVDNKIIEKLSLKQSLAIIMHELAHLIYNHHEKKLLKTITLDAILIFLVLCATAFIESALIQNNIEKEWSYLISCPLFLGAGLIGKKIIENYMFNLEFQADHFAASILGTENFLSALHFCINQEKNKPSPALVQSNLNLINKIYTNIRLPAKTHPNINQRTKMLNKHFTNIIDL